MNLPDHIQALPNAYQFLQPHRPTGISKIYCWPGGIAVTVPKDRDLHCTYEIPGLLMRHKLTRQQTAQLIRAIRIHRRQVNAAQDRHHPSTMEKLTQLDHHCP